MEVQNKMQEGNRAEDDGGAGMESLLKYDAKELMEIFGCVESTVRSLAVRYGWRKEKVFNVHRVVYYVPKSHIEIVRKGLRYGHTPKPLPIANKHKDRFADIRPLMGAWAPFMLGIIPIETEVKAEDSPKWHDVATPKQKCMTKDNYQRAKNIINKKLEEGLTREQIDDILKENWPHWKRTARRKYISITAQLKSLEGKSYMVHKSPAIEVRAEVQDFILDCVQKKMKNADIWAMACAKGYDKHYEGDYKRFVNASYNLRRRKGVL